MGEFKLDFDIYKMGCASSRHDKSQEEEILERLERNLLFYKNSSSEVDLIIRKYSFQGMINENHWVNIVKLLNLNYTSENIKDYYKTYENKEKGGIVLNQILVLGILNGNDSKETKARLLFEAFDVFDTKVLDKSTLRHLFDTIAHVSVENAKILVKVMNQAEKEEKLIEFLERINGNKKEMRKVWIKDIVQEQENISLNRFVEYLKADSGIDILSTSGFRHSLKKFKGDKKDN